MHTPDTILLKSGREVASLALKPVVSQTRFFHRFKGKKSKKFTFKWKVTAVRLQVRQNFYAVQFANYVEQKLATWPKKICFKFHQLGVTQKNFFCLPTGVAFRIWLFGLRLSRPKLFQSCIYQFHK